MKSLHCIVLAIISLTACHYERIKGNGQVTRETRKVDTYHKIVLGGDMELTFTQGPMQDAVIEAESNLLPYIETRNEGDELVIKTKDNSWIAGNHGIKITLSAPEVNSLSLPGSGKIIITNTLQSNKPVDVDLSGSGNITGAVNSPGVEVSLSGSGNIDLTGDTKDLQVDISGSGEYHGANLHAETAKAEISGSGNIDLHASVKLEASVSGSGDVRYRGTPQVSSSVSGSGSVKKAD